MTKIQFTMYSDDFNAILRWSDQFLDNGWLDCAHGRKGHRAVYTIDIYNAMEIIAP